MVLPVGPARFYGSGLPRPFIYSDVKFNSERVDPPLGVTTPFMTWANDAHWSMGGICLKRKRMQGRIEGNVKKLRAEEEKETKIKNRAEKEKNDEEKKKNKKRKTDKDALAKGDSASGSPKSKGSSSPKEKGITSPKSKGSSSPKEKGITSPKNKGYSSPESPAASPIDSPTDNNPRKRRVFKLKWSDEDEDEEGDLPLVAPESKKKPSKKRLPRVRISVRKLGDVFNQQAMDGSDAPCDQGTESHKVSSVVLQATKRQAGKIMGVYDYVAVPDRVMKMTPKRVSPKKNPGKFPASKAPSPVDSVRRSNRLSLTPSAGYP